MLRLEKITKHYKVGEKIVEALNGITVDFAGKGLVAVLGPSGCGKTTLMNIIGGLDRATAGDLVIDNKSTKGYSEKDWNNYRNHQIGFVFQAYNLIPHMTVFSNVELALTLSGVSAKERKSKVLDALAKVGLSDQVSKKPNQMSGGQMQRVAIARAIVNNPKILLADEPTGAVDSKTGVQIMELLKEISKECLVILVTHNQELADMYADRIIRMQDGLIVSDREIIRQYDAAEGPEGPEKKKRAKMSFATATKLSFNNLVNKKGRSIMTIISGAISVICIALILSMNSGFAYYINDFERNNLSRFPIKVTTQTTSLIDLLKEAFQQGNRFDPSSINLDSMLELFREDQELREKYTDKELIFLSKLVLAVIEKGITGFQNLEDFDFDNEYDLLSKLFGVSLGTDIYQFMLALENDFNPDWGAIMRNYNLQFDIYRKDDKGNESKLNPADMFIKFIEDSGLLAAINLFAPGASGRLNSLLYGKDMQELREMFDKNNPWSMMIDDEILLNAQYDVLAGRLPAFGTEDAKREIVLVVDEFNQLDDYTLFLLGAISVESFLLTVINDFRVLLPEEAEKMLDVFIRMLIPKNTGEVKEEYTFEEFIGDEANGIMPATFVLRIPTDYFALDEATGVYNKTGEGAEVKVVGILRLKDGVNAGVINGAIGYTEALARDLIQRGNNAPVVKALEEALNRYDIERETLLNLAKRISEIELDIDYLPSMPETRRLTLLKEILAAYEELNLTQEQISLITEIAGGLYGFEFTPENADIINRMAGLYAQLDVTEEEYAEILRLARLINTLENRDGYIDAITRVTQIISNLDTRDQNADVLARAAVSLWRMDPTEEDIQNLIEIANLLNGLRLTQAEAEAAYEAARLLATLQIDYEDTQIIGQIIDELKGLSFGQEDISTVIQIAQIFRGVNYGSDGQILTEMAALLPQLISAPTPELCLEFNTLMNQLTPESRDAITAAWPLLVSLSPTPSDIQIILNAVLLARGLGLTESEIEAVIEAAQLLSTIELTQEDFENLYAVAMILSEMIEQQDIEILIETAAILREMDFTEEDIDNLNLALDIISAVEVPEADAGSFKEAFEIIRALGITRQDIETAIGLASLGAQLDMESEDMVTLRDTLAAAARLYEITGEEGMLKMWQTVQLIQEFNPTEEDAEALSRMQYLLGQINLTEEEQQALREILEFSQENGGNGSLETMANFLILLQKVKLDEAEQAAAIELVELAMATLEYPEADITAATGLIRSVFAINFTESEIDLVIKMLPILSGLDFSKGESELMNQLAEIFKIRNVTVAEDKVCAHRPNAPHTAECAYIDTVQYDVIMSGFDLRDLMRPVSVDIYPYSIESRNEVIKFIDNYNRRIMQDAEFANSTIDYTVVYTDELSEMTASMTSMINTITYILIGVAAIAVIVAMLLVAIILYISVQDRTKEIGLLRSLGASKFNVSSVFIAETFIIGLVSGIVGVCLALILTFPANIVIKSVLGINNLLRPVWWHQFLLIGVSFVITVISGLIPAALAAKKDPVLALRTE